MKITVKYANAETAQRIFYSFKDVNGNRRLNFDKIVFSVESIEYAKELINDALETLHPGSRSIRKVTIES